MATRIGVDIGGTFSDLIYLDDQTGEVGVAKGPSTPAAPEHCRHRPGHTANDRAFEAVSSVCRSDCCQGQRDSR